MQAKTSGGRDFQGNLLGGLVDREQITTIYLRNRMSLRGRILEFDPYVLLLEPLDGGPPHMVYKSSVVSISGPVRPVRRGPPPGRGPGGPGGPRRPPSHRPPDAGAHPSGPPSPPPRPFRPPGPEPEA